MLWLTVVVALSVSWWLDNKRIENTLKAVKAEYDAKQLELDDKLDLVNQMYMDEKRRQGWHVIKGFPPKQQKQPKTAFGKLGQYPAAEMVAAVRREGHTRSS